MGCTASDLNDDFCTYREFGAFMPPNGDQACWQFDYLVDGRVKLLHGELAAPCEHGYLLDPQRAPEAVSAGCAGKLPQKWCILREYGPSPEQLRLCVSGRVFLQLPDEQALKSRIGIASCVFAVCTRGLLRQETLSPSLGTLNHMHSAKVVSSGVVFGVFLAVSESGGIRVFPKVLLTLDSGDDIILSDDQLGPIASPRSFVIDFCLVDEGGRNIQFDVICRGEGAEDEESSLHRSFARSVRTCLQDYTALNSFIYPPSISVGNSNLATHVPSANVYLQNIVVSDERFEEDLPAPGPYPVGREVARLRDAGRSTPVNLEGFDMRPIWREKQLRDAGRELRDAGRAALLVFEGEDARTIWQERHSPAKHPQLIPPSKAASRSAEKSHGDSQTESSIVDCWWHIKYGDDDDISSLDTRGTRLAKNITGEFWLTKLPVEKKGIYFQCSSTLSQALTMCIAFRFSCPQVKMSMISEGQRAARALRTEHIPTNGIVMGLEHDPRDQNLLRMFIEHRNEVLDDITVCECRDDWLVKSIVHQEIYDGGDWISYRLTIIHQDGTRQSVVLRTNVESLDEKMEDKASRGGQDQFNYEPSPRFPISPCSLRPFNLPPDHRIFVYTSVPFSETDAEVGSVFSEASTPETKFRQTSTGGTATPAASDAGGVEDWQSVHGGMSDGELEAKLSSPRPGIGGMPLQVEWHRPLIQSVTLLKKIDDPPFMKCFPKSLS